MIPDNDTLLSYAVQFDIGNYTVHKRSSWWEVFKKDEGFQYNPNNKRHVSYNFSREEAFDFVFKRLTK